MKKLIALLAVLGMMFTSFGAYAGNDATEEDNIAIENAIKANHQAQINAVKQSALDMIAVFDNIPYGHIKNPDNLTEDEAEAFIAAYEKYGEDLFALIKSFTPKEVAFITDGEGNEDKAEEFLTAFAAILVTQSLSAEEQQSFSQVNMWLIQLIQGE